MGGRGCPGWHHRLADSDKLGEPGAVQRFLHRIQECAWHEVDEIRVEVRVEVRRKLQRRWPVRDTSWNPVTGCLRVHLGTPRRLSDKLEASELRNLHCSNRCLDVTVSVTS